MSILLIIVFALLSVIGLLFLPTTVWGGYLFSFSMYFLALVYALFGFAILNGKKLKSSAIRELAFNEAFFAALTGWGIALIILGVLFKFQMWPGADQLLIIGNLAVILMVVLDIYLAVKKEDSIKLAKHAIVHGAIALAIGVLVSTMSYDHVIKFMVKDTKDKKVLIEKYYDWKKSGDMNVKNDFDKLYSDVIKKQRGEE